MSAEKEKLIQEILALQRATGGRAAPKKYSKATNKATNKKQLVKTQTQETSNGIWPPPAYGWTPPIESIKKIMSSSPCPNGELCLYLIPYSWSCSYEVWLNGSCPNNTSGRLFIYMKNTDSVAGYQFRLEGLNITNLICCGLCGCNYLSSNQENSNLVLGFDAGGDYIPAGGHPSMTPTDPYGGILIWMDFNNYTPGDFIQFAGNSTDIFADTNGNPLGCQSYDGSNCNFWSEGVWGTPLVLQYDCDGNLGGSGGHCTDEGDVYGCCSSSACNYVADATICTECTYPETYYNCDGQQTSCPDCGECSSPGNCNCFNMPSGDCDCYGTTLDCLGYGGGCTSENHFVYDDCGVCGGPNTYSNCVGNPPNNNCPEMDCQGNCEPDGGWDGEKCYTDGFGTCGCPSCGHFPYNCCDGPSAWNASDCNGYGGWEDCACTWAQCAIDATCNDPCSNPEAANGGLWRCTGGCCYRSCFVADTWISTPSGLIPIQNIEVGDEVYTFKNGSDELIISVVEKLLYHSPEETAFGLYKINTDSKEVIVTGEHSFATSVSGELKWDNVVNFNIGDKLYIEDGEIETITSVEKLDYLEETYNFEVKDTHTYIANGFRVHNANKHPCWEKGQKRDCMKVLDEGELTW